MTEIAISDTCFPIDWSGYRKRDLLFKLFSTVFVPEEVLNEITSEKTIEWVAGCLAERKLSLYVASPVILEEASKIINKMASLEWARRIELPEAVCLAAGKKHGYVVLTENKGAMQAVEIIQNYSSVKIMRAIDVLTTALLTSKVSVTIRKMLRYS